MSAFFAKLRAMDWQHIAILVFAVGVAVVTAWQAQTGKTLMVAGVGVLGVLTTIAAILKNPPAALAAVNKDPSLDNSPVTK